MNRIRKPSVITSSPTFVFLSHLFTRIVRLICSVSILWNYYYIIGSDTKLLINNN